MLTPPPTTIPATTHLIPTAVITARATTAARVITTVATVIAAATDAVITAADITAGTINQRLNGGVFQMNKDFINHLFQLVAGTHQMPKTLSDFSTVTD
jgi:spore maturation protein SpmA